MRVIKVEDYNKLSELAAEIIAGQVSVKADSVLGLATGSSPIGTYKVLVEKYNKGLLDFSKIKTVNLDEYVGLDGESDQSYRYFMDENLFNQVNINKANTNVPNGKAQDTLAECERYENLIKELGGVDLQLLGIGYNGHIGFNEPDGIYPNIVHIADLTESTITANSRLFEKVEDVPTQAFTMGIGTIMRAKKILLVAAADKADVVEQAATGPVTPQLPASILQLHSDVTVIVAGK